MSSELPLSKSRVHVPPVPPPEARAPEGEPSAQAGPVDRVVEAPPPSMFTATSDVAAAVGDAASPASRFRRVAASMGSDVQKTMQVFERAGLPAADAFELACAGASPGRAKEALRVILASRPALADYGPAAVAVAALGAVAGSQGSVAPGELQSMLRAHARTHVVRPDGYLVRGLTGAPTMQARGLEPGKLYAVELGLVFPRAAGGGADRTDPPLAEVPLDPLLAGHVLNGAEAAIMSAAEGVAQVLTDPVETIHDLGRLPSTVAHLLASSPELLERFVAMPLGAQVEAASELLFTAALAEIGLGAAAKVPGAASRASVSLGGGLHVQLGGAAAQLGELTVSLEAAGALAPALAGASAGVVFASSLGPGKGPQSALPSVDIKAQASLKRAAKEIDKDELQALKKALPRLEKLRGELIGQLDELITSGRFNERTRTAFARARRALDHHGSQADLAGALRDRVGIPVRQSGSGYVWDHLHEVRDLTNSLKKARSSAGFEARQAGMRGDAPDPSVLALIEALDAMRDGVVLFLEGPR